MRRGEVCEKSISALTNHPSPLNSGKRGTKLKLVIFGVLNFYVFEYLRRGKQIKLQTELVTQIFITIANTADSY